MRQETGAIAEVSTMPFHTAPTNRGLDNVRGEWSLVTMAYNMKRLFALAAAA